MSFFEAGYVAVGYEGASDTGVEYERTLSAHFNVETAFVNSLISVNYNMQAQLHKLVSFNYKLGDFVWEDILSANYAVIDGAENSLLDVRYDSPIPIFEVALLNVNYDLGSEYVPPIIIVRKDEND